MALQILGFEGGTAGSALSTTNPPTAAGDTKFGVVTTTGTATGTVSSADAAHGTKCMECVQTSTTSSTEFGTWSGYTATSAAFRFYFKVTTLPGSNVVIMRSFNNSAVRWLSVQVNSLNKLVLQLTNSDTTVYTSTSAISANTWYRVEGSVTMGNASNAVVNFKYYVGDSLTSVDAGLAITNGNTGTGTQMADFRFGIVSSTIAFTLRMDDLAVNDGTTTFIGPSLTPPTASYTYSRAGLTLSVDGTGSTAVSPATVSSYDWNWGDGTTHGTGSTASHTYATAGTYSVVLTVTDSNALTNPSTQSVVISAPAGTVTAESIATAPSWTASSGTVLSCITDSDNTTLVTSSAPPTAQEFDIVLQAMTPPSSGQPLKVFFTMDAPLSTSASLAAQLYEGATQRSSLTGVTIASGSGATVTNVVTLTFPWTDVQNVTTGGWNALTVKLQVTAS
jgi:hypothetical protein